MRKKCYLRYLFAFLSLVLFLAGCSKNNNATISVNVTTPIEVGKEVLCDVSIALPEGMTRKVVSNIQHDFILDEQQIGGIVVVDISNDLLDAPLEQSLAITDLLGKQVLSGADPEYTTFMCAGGNAYAYMEVYTGGEQIQYVHYLFRGEANKYDVWFAYNLVNDETINNIIASVSSDDITAELNKSVI